jgi:SAM-dependent methyltransferase
MRRPRIPARLDRYFVRMGSARDDKARLLDHVRPGRIVEIGPGGGVVLDLLADRFPTSEVIGIDASATVVAALERRRIAEGRRWTVQLGDAFDLASRVAPGTVDSVVLCSVLHEVYSYVEHRDDAGGPDRRFNLASVREFCRAAFATLVTGGRLVIRDGVRPPAGTRRVRLIADDAAPLFARFVAEFPGRAIAYTRLAPDRVELSSADAMEFLYTYTWGAASFDHEVREQLGVLTYDDYGASLVEWLGGPDRARLVELPPDLRSYLQPGYVTHLAGRIELTDEHDRPVALPDSNCAIVVERS